MWKNSTTVHPEAIAGVKPLMGFVVCYVWMHIIELLLYPYISRTWYGLVCELKPYLLSFQLLFFMMQGYNRFSQLSGYSKKMFALDCHMKWHKWNCTHVHWVDKKCKSLQAQVPGTHCIIDTKHHYHPITYIYVSPYIWLVLLKTIWHISYMQCKTLTSVSLFASYTLIIIMIMIL